STLRSLTARRTFSMSRSKGNSGVWTPISTSPLSPYFFAHARRYGRVRSQLMQVKVQKSTATTLPRKPAGVSGGELSHAFAPVNAGRLPSIGNSAARALSRRNSSASGETSGGAGTPGRWVAANGSCLVFMLGYPSDWLSTSTTAWANDSENYANGVPKRSAEATSGDDFRFLLPLTGRAG